MKGSPSIRLLPVSTKDPSGRAAMQIPYVKGKKNFCFIHQQVKFQNEYEELQIKIKLWLNSRVLGEMVAEVHEEEC